ncbi:hypothetical protein C0J52_22592 [Blattella germanica]|nr:hypothetical protein C0J52_22592 [Blattella germanica]
MTEERRNCDRVEKLDMQEHNYPKNTQPSDPGEELSTLETSCFICGNVMMNGTPLHFLTEITKVKFLHKLDNILSELSFVMDEKQILCSRCTRLINYIDHTEVQLSKLHRSIFNCVYARHVKSCPNVELLLPDFIEHNPQVVSLIQEDKELIEDGEDLHSNQENGNQSEKLHKCKLCYFKTNYQSVMIYHLRQHLVTTRRCDFCSKKLPAHTLDQYRLNTNGNCESLSEGEGTAKSLNDLAEEEIVVQSITNCTEHEDCKCKTKSVDLESRSPKDTEMKIKYHPFEPESVEDMVEELHNTGQVSAFMNNSTYDCKSNNIQYKMKDPLEKKTDIGDTPDDFADECSHKLVKRELVNSQCKIKDTFDIRLNGSSVTTDECTHKVVKRELMNVDEISDQAIKESIVLNRNNALIDFLEVKRESPTS